MLPKDFGYEAFEQGEAREPNKAYPNDPEKASEWAEGWDEASVEATERRDRKIANRIDGYDRDDLGESPDY